MWQGRVRQQSQQTMLPAEFDWQQLRQLAGGDPEFEKELLTMFLDDAEASLRQLESAIASKSTTAIEDIGHSLRGASANVGASAMAAVARQLEQAAQKGKMTSASKLLQQLDTHCKKIRAQLQF